MEKIRICRFDNNFLWGGNKRIQWGTDAYEDTMTQDIRKLYMNSSLKRT